MSSQDHEPAIDTSRHEAPVELLRDLIRFDTTNPPGNEGPCIEWIAQLCSAYDIEYDTYASEPDRPVLHATIPGGEAPPLLLYGHVDVVAAEGDWTHPPFEAVLEDGYLWGRGALDMKAGVSMFLASFLRAASEEIDLAGDLELMIVPDEEAGGDVGMGFMVEEHPEVFAETEYALGEFGGFPMKIADQRFFPIQVNEKQICWLEATIHGDGGHGSLPRRDDATARMARFIDRLDRNRLPVHITPAVEEMVDRIAAEISQPKRLLLRSLMQPQLTNRVLDIMGEDGRTFDALTHNVVNETIIRGGTKENVVPETVSVTLDCRMVPGEAPADVIAEIESTVGDVAEHVDFEVQRFDPGPAEADLGLFDTLAAVLEATDEDAVGLPYLLPASSDARHLTHVDVQSYGFTPMNLPDDFDFMSLVHAPDERIPPDCVEWGTDRVFEAIQKYDA